MKKSEKEELKKAFNIPEPERKEEFVRKYSEKIKKNSRFSFPLFFRYASTVAFAVLIIGVWNYTSKTADFRNIEVNDPEYMTTVTTVITAENAPPDSTEQRSGTYTTLKNPEIQKPDSAVTTSEMTSVYYSSPLVTSATLTTIRQETPTTITTVTISQQPTETIMTTTTHQQPTETVTPTAQSPNSPPLTIPTEPIDPPPQTQTVTTAPSENSVTTTTDEDETGRLPAVDDTIPPVLISTTTKIPVDILETTSKTSVDILETTSKVTDGIPETTPVGVPHETTPVGVPELTTTSTTTETTTTTTTTISTLLKNPL